MSDVKSATRARPILFQDELVSAILEGRKTETRRLVKPRDPYPGRVDGFDTCPRLLETGEWAWLLGGCTHAAIGGSPFGEAGDRLWVRECHVLVDGPCWSGLPKTPEPGGHRWAYYRTGFDRCPPKRWRPSIHMPRWASRLTLEVDEVRIERLQDLDEDGAVAEGFTDASGLRTVWDGINGKRGEGASWEANPWVWVVRFHLAEAA